MLLTINEITLEEPIDFGIINRFFTGLKDERTVVDCIESNRRDIEFVVRRALDKERLGNHVPVSLCKQEWTAAVGIEQDDESVSDADIDEAVLRGFEAAARRGIFPHLFAQRDIDDFYDESSKPYGDKPRVECALWRMWEQLRRHSLLEDRMLPDLCAYATERMQERRRAAHSNSNPPSENEAI